MKLIQVIDFNFFGSDWLNVALRASADADMLWFRIKNEEDDVLRRNAEILRHALPQMPMVLSGRADIAHQLGYQGVHLGANSENPSDIKQKFPDLLVGYSAHGTDEILSVDADYYTLSPIFFTKKDYDVVPIGVIDVREIKKDIFALGGINAVNCGQLMGMGYAGVAGISFFGELPQIKEILS